MNVKPGDLAIVVESDYKPAIGTVVEVIEAAGFAHDSDVFQWFVKPPRPMKCWSPSGELIECSIIGCPDSWLRPVSGLPLHDDVLDEVTA